MEPGQHIGKYVLEEKLGEGGNGAVYAARDTMLGRRVAVKLLHTDLVTDATVAGRFRQEAQAMAQLTHPNVVVMHDFVTDGQRWAIVMELVEHGETLGGILKREQRLAPARALRLASGVAAALGHAHARGIVHRDVKPANVLVVRDHGREMAKLTDFGIARVMHGERRTHAQLTLGTLWYIAPEQAQSSGVDARADVYSLGATLYEAVTGRVIFPYDNVARVLAAHIGEMPPTPAQLVPGLPPAVDRLIMRCIAKSPADRPNNGEQMRRELDDALAQIERDKPQAIPPTREMGEVAPPAAHTPRTVPMSMPPVASTPSVAPVTSPHAFAHTAYAPSPSSGASHPAITTPGTPPMAMTPSALATTPGSAARPTGISEQESRLGLYIGLGSLVLVTGVCLLGSLLCVISSYVR